MKISCVIYRGGTSKGVYFHDRDLPQDPELRDRVILRVFGSPDRRQIDGLGGADLLTSKVVVMRPGTGRGADVDYLFGQVGIEDASIDWATICGNLSAAVGPFAVDEKLVTPREPVTEITINCPATGKVIKTEVPVVDEMAASEGDYAIWGVPGTGAKVTLDYSDTAGGVTGRLLPTGNVRDIISVAGYGKFEVSIVDCGNPMVFAWAQDVGLRGDEWPTEIDSNKELVQKIEAIRRAVAELLGMVERFGWDKVKSPVLPVLSMIQRPRSYTNFVTRQEIKAEEMDFLAIMFAANMIHKAYAGTTTVCTGVAAKIPGTIVNEAVSEEARQRDVVRIGHPSGHIPAESAVHQENGRFVVDKIKLWRTARRIMEGYVYVPDSLWAGN